MKVIKLASIFALTAVAVAVSSTTFAGIDLVKSDDVTVNMNGDIDLIIQNETSNDAGTEIESNFDDLDFDFKWKVDDSITFIAASDWTVESDEDETVENDQSWAGFAIGSWTVRAGTQEDSIDPLGIDSFENIDMGRASGDMDGSGTKMEQSILVKYEADSFEVSGTYVDPSEGDNIPQRYALSAEIELGDLTIAGGIGEEENYAKDVSVSFYQGQAEYNFGQLTLGALFSSQSIKQDSGTNYDSTGFELDAQYKVSDKLTVQAGYETITNDISGEDDYTATAVGATYAFSKLVKLYVEAGTYDGTYVKGKSSSIGTATFDGDSAVAMMLSLDF